MRATEPKSRILGRGAIDVSFEFFPPKTAAMEETLWRAIRRLEPLASAASSRSPTAPAARRASARTPPLRACCARRTLKPAAHLTCVAATKDRGRRGHPRLLGPRRPPHRGAARRPAGRRRRRATSRRRAATSMPPIWSAASSSIAPFEISVACYPEKHPESPLGRGRHRHAEGQDRCRRRPRHQPVLLRQRGVSSAISTACARAASPSRSCRASFPSTISSRCRASPPAPARACPIGSATDSKGLTTIRRRAIW